MLDAAYRGIVFTPEQRDRCFIYANKSETGKVTQEEVLEAIPQLEALAFAPEISEEMLELVRGQNPQDNNDEELLQVGWEVIGTVIDVGALFFHIFFFLPIF